MGRLIGVLVLILVLYAIITQPLNSAATVNDGLDGLSSAGTNITRFLSGVMGPSGTLSASTSRASTGSGTSTGTYRVRPGDTLSSIAAAHGTTAAALAARNGISNRDRITTGQRLSLG